MTEKFSQNFEQKEYVENIIESMPINEDLQKRYDEIDWNSFAYEGTRRDDLIPKLLEIADIKDDDKVLDAMCGTSNLLKESTKKYPNCDYFALDFSIGQLKNIPLEINKIQASVIAMPFDDKSFNKIFIRSGLHDLPRKMHRNALCEIQRILKEDGIFILQTFFTTFKNQLYYNNIVNRKDWAAGYYKHPKGLGSEEYPRHFATKEELEKWFDEVGFNYEFIEDFEGVITYLKTKEMHWGQKEWKIYMDSLPENIKKEIQLRSEEGAEYVYNFPGVIYKITKKR